MKKKSSQKAKRKGKLGKDAPFPLRTRSKKRTTEETGKDAPFPHRAR
jgi:hypothetical protein